MSAGRLVFDVRQLDGSRVTVDVSGPGEFGVFAVAVAASDRERRFLGACPWRWSSSTSTRQ